MPPDDDNNPHTESDHDHADRPSGFAAVDQAAIDRAEATRREEVEKANLSAAGGDPERLREAARASYARGAPTDPREAALIEHSGRLDRLEHHLGITAPIVDAERPDVPMGDTLEDRVTRLELRDALLREHFGGKLPDLPPADPDRRP